jgi:hypothetical protein
VTLVDPGQTGVTPTGTALKLVDGSVTVDANAAMRTTGDMTLAEPWSDDGTGVAPYGQEVYVERGVVFGNGAREFVGLGYLRLNEVSQDEAPLGPLRVRLEDRMAGLVEARLLAPVQYDSATTYGTVFLDLVQEVYSFATIEWDDDSDLESLGRGAVAEEDRYGFLNDLVVGLGKVWYWDHRGVLVIKTPPDDTTPVFTVDAGARGVLVQPSRALTRENVYNAVVVRGEGAGDEAAAYGVAYDLNLASLTYWNGTFGKVPRFYASPFITTDAQAVVAATRLLQGYLGLPYEVNFTMVPNVALEPLDAVLVVYPPDLSKNPKIRQETHVLDTLAIPLTGAGAMRATTRLATNLET